MTSRAATLSLILLAAVSTAADGRVAVVAHRGWHKAPGVGAENSIAALAAAQEAGFWGSEFDVHMSLPPSSRIYIAPGGEPFVGWNLANPLPGSTCIVECAPSLNPSPSSWSTNTLPSSPFFRIRLSHPSLD